ncbi:TetR/AcrR family transcriptional regulator C-terminal domain-containing protein [Actinomadura luteofluorescens]|uniref:TetR/AcrR family transcriptional regulator C-terminal domain-containing protein n=1 Tax=Actinomadura luteofluorescens TaxID=46163 RepID=UPI003625A701
MPKRIAGLAVSTLGMFLDADAIEDTMHHAKTPPGAGDPWTYFQTYLDQIREYFAALPKDRYPTISGMVDELTGEDGDGRFEFGLDMLIRGIASYVEEPSSPRKDG